LFNFWEGKIGGTREVHRLIQLAQSLKGAEIRDRILDDVSSAFHERAMDITDREVLKAIAIEAGVGTEEANEWMDKDKDVDGEQLGLQLERARKLIGTEKKGVPVVIVQGKYRFDGAPDISELLGTLVSIRDGKTPEEGDEMQEHINSNAC
jgi:predicted DsbA family dithiol-disulfide isomerase